MLGLKLQTQTVQHCISTWFKLSVIQFLEKAQTVCLQLKQSAECHFQTARVLPKLAPLSVFCFDY